MILSTETASEIARTHFGLEAAAQRVDGYDAPSFLIAINDVPSFVLKVCDNAEGAATLEVAMLEHLARRRLPLRLPRVHRNLDGAALTTVKDERGEACTARLLEYLGGEFAADLPAAEGRLLRSVGRGLGAVAQALLDFSHPLAVRQHHWHLLQAPRVCAGAPLDPEAGALVERSLAGYDERVRPALATLRRSVIHADGNDHNLLVSQVPGRGALASGLIDFGDATLAPTIFDAAIAMAYFMMRQKRPVLAGQELLAAYHHSMPLTGEEIELLYDLVRVRLSMTLCHAARAKNESRANAYLLRSEAGALALLRSLDQTPRLFFSASMRDACGLSPWPAGRSLAKWISQQSPRPLLANMDGARIRVLDFTPLSEDLRGRLAPRDLAEFESLIEQLLADAGATVGIGRYGEIRGLYQSKVFVNDDEEEARTVHLGVDVFAPAGTQVCAPFAGRVHSFVDNARPLDYGPTIILEHHFPDAPGVFYTLYGHLARSSLCGLETGKNIAAGDRFASIGDHDVNGGWPPHLHFQVMADMLGNRGDFPGVARHSEVGVWKSLCPNPARFVGLDDAALDADCGLSPVELARRRDLVLSPSLSVAFASPVKIVRGRGTYLYTEQGRKILDLVNNVAHVGHAHPHVVAAVSAQEAKLNTNTRYLHDGLVSYAERLVALLPPELDTCFLVCTGSEANELALRLARACTGGTDVVVVDGAYHGHSSGLIELSPYKFMGPGGGGRARHVQVASMPDTYNGRFRDMGNAAHLYAQSVSDAFARVTADGRKPAAFFCESALGCGGQIILPAGYLSESAGHARAAGALYVADEVQVGFGRLGGGLWGFEAQGVVPDILTLGKPIGNGYPLAAVVTRRDIAEAFANGMEYFNTFGGNPVACAAGNAVLDVVLEQNLADRAKRLGARWLSDLRRLMADHELIGDVRGMGLFIGIELVRSRTTREAHAEAATAIQTALSRRDIQISIDGPRYNVLKIKPPMVISESETRRVTEALDEALAEFTGS